MRPDAVSLALLVLVLAAGCSSPRPRQERPPVFHQADSPVVAASSRGASAPTSAARGGSAAVEAYIAQHPETPATICYALRAGQLQAGSAGMDAEQVLLVVDSRAIASQHQRELAWHDGPYYRRGWVDVWCLHSLQRWRELYFQRGRLRGWLAQDAFVVEMFD